jgi:hypothetical protein
MPQACVDCVAAAGHDMNALAACSGVAPRVTDAQTPYADCNALQLPTDRANCLDLHLAGQR